MIEVRRLGLLAYREALGEQRRCREELLRGGPEVLLVLEHPAVITLGRTAPESDLGLPPSEWERRGVEVARVERGGRATYHGPGQVVAYAVLDLRRAGRSLRGHVSALEDAGSAAARRFGVDARPGRDPVGVFVGPAKLASVGVAVSRSVTQHGIALNVSNDLAVYQDFIPCGLVGVPTVRLKDLARGEVSWELAAESLAGELVRRLDAGPLALVPALTGTV